MKEMWNEMEICLRIGLGIRLRVWIGIVLRKGIGIKMGNKEKKHQPSVTYLLDYSCMNKLGLYL